MTRLQLDGAARMGRLASLRLLAAGATLVAVAAMTPLGAQPPAGSPPPSEAGPRGPGRGREMMMRMLFQGITLSDAQRTRVDSVLAAYAARRRVPGAGGAAMAGPPDTATIAARRQAMQEERASIRSVLTADQQQTFDANVAQLEARMRERMGGGAGRPPRERR